MAASFLLSLDRGGGGGGGSNGGGGEVKDWWGTPQHYILASGQDKAYSYCEDAAVNSLRA